MQQQNNNRAQIEEMLEVWSENASRIGLRAEHPLETATRRKVDKEFLDAIYDKDHKEQK